MKADLRTMPPRGTRASCSSGVDAPHQALRSCSGLVRIAGSALVALLLVQLLPSSTALAQSGGPYELTSWTVDGGGETFSTGGGYRLGGTTGQPDAGLLTGGPYTLGGGFWGGGEVTVATYDYGTYLPLVLRDAP